MRAKKLISMILTLVLVLSLVIAPAPVRAAGNANPYIADLIGYYKSYQEAAETDIMRTLEEMAQVDPIQAEAWTKIMDYWSFINTEMVVNIGTVPEGLPEDNSVAIVILGFALNSDGTMKPELIGRLETGLAIAEAYPNSYVVVTGGGTASGNPNVTEGGLMGEWLLEQGLAEDRLIIENKAPNTVGNAENTYKILAEEYPQVDSFVMVTSDYHVPRGCILFYSKCLLAAYASGGEPLDLISNAGYYTGSNGYETISLQASGVASVAGVSASSNPKLSSLVRLTVSYDGELAVEAGYDSDYSRDVTKKAVITGFDPELGADQTITVSYTENDITMAGEFTLSDGKTDFFSVAHLENLIATAKAISPATYTRDSYAALTAAIEAAENLLGSGSYTLAEVDETYAALNAAIAALKPLVNVALKMNVTANCNQSNAQKVTDGTISTSNYWAGQNGSTNVPANQSELVIDLNGTYDLEAVRVYPYYNGQRIYQYELFGSVDGESWEKIGENVSEEYITSNGITHEVDATAAYIKLVGIKTKVVGRDDINNLHIIEIQAFGTEVDNLAYGKPVISSGSDQSAASSAGAAETKVNDGDPSSYWDAGKYENSPWVIVDLQGLYDLDKLNIITYWKSGNRYYHYDLYASVDGQEWVKVGAKEHNTPETIFGETFDLSGQGIRAAYVKLVGVFNSANSAFHVNEIRVYGTEAHVHSYKPVVTDPTCTEDGYTTYTCDCGDSYTDVIEATGHKYEPVVTDPTCTEAGYTTYTCVCGDSYVTDKVAALGHSIVDDVCERCDAVWNGIDGDYYYIDGVLQRSYQLFQYKGNYYFINDYNKIAKSTSLYLGERFVEGTEIPAGRYEFDANGVMQLNKNGVIDGYLYINGARQSGYQLAEFDGNFYFLNGNHKIATGTRLYMSEKFVEGKTYNGKPLAVGWYDFDEEGKLNFTTMPEYKHGIVGGYLYINNVRQNGYQLAEFEGDFYFIYGNHTVATDVRLYMSARFVDGKDIEVGYYDFGLDGKMIIE